MGERKIHSVKDFGGLAIGFRQFFSSLLKLDKNGTFIEPMTRTEAENRIKMANTRWNGELKLQ